MITRRIVISQYAVCYVDVFTFHRIRDTVYTAGWLYSVTTGTELINTGIDVTHQPPCDDTVKLNEITARACSLHVLHR